MNQSKKSISIVILLSLIFTMTFVSISQSPALECATFTGQPPSLETSETESLPPNDTSLTSEQAITVIDIAPVNQVIFAS